VLGNVDHANRKPQCGAELIKRGDVKRLRIRGGGDDRNTTPEYWVGEAALEAPQRKRRAAPGANARLVWEHSGRHGCHPTNSWGMDRDGDGS
jgi:hypothetical protein